MNLLGLDVALVDFVGTIVLGVLVGIIIGLPFYILMGLHRLKGYDMLIFWSSVILPSIIFMFILGFILHSIFGVKTAINK
jgi:ABC-type dipeptide/oligopeptide/nickel transport system permease component